MQTVTNNQEQTVKWTRDIIDNYIESQRDITNSFQSAWSSFFDNYFWISPKRITETYARTVSSISDRTIASHQDMEWNCSCKHGDYEDINRVYAK